MGHVSVKRIPRRRPTQSDVRPPQHHIKIGWRIPQMYVSSWLSVARDVVRKTHLYKPQPKYHIIQNADTAQTNPTGLLRPRTHIPVMQCLQKIPPHGGIFIVSIDFFHLTVNLFSPAKRAPGHLRFYQNVPAPHPVHDEHLVRDGQIPESYFYLHNIAILHF